MPVTPTTAAQTKGTSCTHSHSDDIANLALGHVRAHEGLDAPRLGARGGLDHGKIVAYAVLVLEEHGAAAALDLALRHDRDAVAQQVCLVHEVRREDDDAALASILSSQRR
jgi:hypothetical protein